MRNPPLTIHEVNTVIRQIEISPCSAADLVRILNLRRSIVDRALQVLRKNGLVRCGGQWLWRSTRPSPTAVETILALRNA